MGALRLQPGTNSGPHGQPERQKGPECRDWVPLLECLFPLLPDPGSISFRLWSMVARWIFGVLAVVRAHIWCWGFLLWLGGLCVCVA